MAAGTSSSPPPQLDGISTPPAKAADSQTAQSGSRSSPGRTEFFIPFLEGSDDQNNTSTSIQLSQLFTHCQGRYRHPHYCTGEASRLGKGKGLDQYSHS